jgi:acetyl-CoA C-acetyltransferase
MLGGVNMIDDPVVIVAAARTPMGAFQGAFSTVSAVELGAVVTRLALKQSGLVSADVDELLFGCVLPAGLLQAPARQVALAADLPLATQ